jgi:nitrogen permease regulator 2
MSAHLDTFLPHIESAFYATFHETRGPQILYQVPEGLIYQGSSSSNSLANNASRSGNGCQLPGRGYVDPMPSVSTTAVATPSSSTTSLSLSDMTKISESPGRMHRTSNASSVSTLDRSSPSSPASSRSLQQHRHLRAYSPSNSPRKSASPRSAFGATPLLDFSDISRFVIPTQDMCGRLVICATQRHRIIGFPVCLDSEAKYKRNHFIYNLCFVFERTADLSCYEPVVRKIARVLMACEARSNVFVIKRDH